MLWVVACSCHLCPTADDSDYHGGSDVAAAIQLDRQCGIHPLPRIYIHLVLTRTHARIHHLYA